MNDEVVSSDAGSLAACATFVEILHWRARHQPGRVGYRLTRADDSLALSLTYSELHRRALALSAVLRHRGLAGERVLLLCPPGRFYIESFFACLYAGAVAVPAYPPRPNRSLQRLIDMAADCDARAALTTGAVRAAMQAGSLAGTPLERLDWLMADAELHGEGSTFPASLPPAAGLAYLQYTSGSTSAPKGVMISHANLMHNAKLAQQSFGTSAESRGVIWLPPYHDMGLVGGLLQPLYSGFPVTVIPPAVFLQRPLVWLKTLSRERGTISSGPNFAYELCVRGITPEQRDQLDLSHWNAALCGSEPVRADTLDRFAAYFAPAGFRREAFMPCYGLAEATVLVSTRQVGGRLSVVDFDAAQLLRHAAQPALGAGRRLVGAGPRLMQQIEIVSPATGQRCAPRLVGEIWLRDPSIAMGYWNRPGETAASFGARLPDGSGPFLRTGDLGVIYDGELFVTGRLKELIILRGKNYYPYDIEPVAAAAHPALQPGRAVAFGAERDGAEHLVLVLERKRGTRKVPVDEVAVAVRRAVAAAFEIEVDTVVLIPPLSMSKTSSGKLERQKCQADFMAGRLRGAAVWRRRAEAAAPILPAALCGGAPPSAADIEA